MKKYSTGGMKLLFLIIYEALTLTFIIVLAPRAVAATAITTFHNDNLRTGWNRYETVLTPANATNLQLLHTVPLDEQVDAQPLYMPGIMIAGGKHNVVYVPTENDTVYAIDAATGMLLTH